MLLGGGIVCLVPFFFCACTLLRRKISILHQVRYNHSVPPIYQAVHPERHINRRHALFRVIVAYVS